MQDEGLNMSEGLRFPVRAGCAVAVCIYPNEFQYELPDAILYRAEAACVSNELSTTRCF